MAETDSTVLALRLGLRLLRGLSQADFASLADVRGAKPFGSIEDLARRARLPRAALVRLAQGAACESLGMGRRDALWEALGESSQAWGLKPRGAQRLLPLEEPSLEPALTDSPPCQGGVGGGSPTPDDNFVVRTHSESSSQRDARSLTPVAHAPGSLGQELPLFPAMTLAEEVTADYQTAGLSLRAHPISFVRERLDARRVLTAAALFTAPAERSVETAGLVLLRQRPATASGITFVTLEDETGTANLVIRPDVWTKFRRAARHARAMLVRGRIDRQARVVHVVVTRITDLSDWLAELGNKSRDFR